MNTTMKQTAIRIYNQLDGLNLALVSRWSAIAGQSIKERGEFHVALAGGKTPTRFYQLLASKAIASTLPWSQTHIYFSDERCVAPDHADSNFHMAKDALLDHVPLPAQQIHRIRGEDPDHAQAAADYQQQLIRHLPADADGYHLDLVLLGLGTDGHIASLFPHTSILEERDALVAAVTVEPRDRWRISMTFPLLEQARHVLIVVAGSDKAQIIEDILGPDAVDHHYPAQRIEHLCEWHIDNEAADRLSPGFQARINDYYDQNSGC